MQYNDNLIISNGYYTTLVAIAILKQLNIDKKPKYLLGYFKQLSTSIEESIELSKQAWNFNEVFDYNLFYRHQFSFEAFGKACKKIKFCNIFIPINSSTKKWYKGLKKLYPSARFIFYEEGLLSYLKPVFDLKLKKIINQNVCFYNNFNKSLNYLVENSFSSVGKSICFIKEEFFYAAMHDIKSLLDISFSKLKLSQSKNVLFIPQYYHNNNEYLFFKKIKQYLQIISLLITNGYTVLIKDHPKDSGSISIEKYFRILLRDNPKVIYLNHISQFPIELFINDLNVQFLFSVYSTTLFSANSIFKLPVFTSYKMLQERIKSFSFYPAVSCSLVKNAVPDLMQFLNYYKHDAKAYYNKFTNNDSVQNYNGNQLFINYLLKL